MDATASQMNNRSSIEINELRKKFLRARPFPHVVIDNFLLDQAFVALNAEMSDYYSLNQDKGKRWDTDAEKGKWGSTGLVLPPNLQRLNEYLSSSDLRSFLTSITGFKNLEVTSNINGLGFSFFHAMRPGSILAPHTDHTRDLNNGPYHVLNIIIYMSAEWDPNWGGGTTLFDRNVELASVVEYRPNRALIFMHSPFSIHGTSQISELAARDRFSIYYDFYTRDEQPYKHLDMTDIKLLDSPHLFYLPKWWMYLKQSNRRYLKMHFSQMKKKFCWYLGAR
jgi:hypothetical protein